MLGRVNMYDWVEFYKVFHRHLAFRIRALIEALVKFDLCVWVLPAIDADAQPCQLGVVLLLLITILLNGRKHNKDVSRKLFAGNAGDSPDGAQFSVSKLISLHSNLLKVESTLRTCHQLSLQMRVHGERRSNLSIHTDRCSMLSLPAAAIWI